MRIMLSGIYSSEPMKRNQGLRRVAARCGCSEHSGLSWITKWFTLRVIFDSSGSWIRMIHVKMRLCLICSGRRFTANLTFVVIKYVKSAFLQTLTNTIADCQSLNELAKTTINEESATPADRNSKPEVSNPQACRARYFVRDRLNTKGIQTCAQRTSL